MAQGKNQRWVLVGIPMKFYILEVRVVSSEAPGELYSESVLYGVSYFHLFINRTE
jgi:hypothetical protein